MSNHTDYLIVGAGQHDTYMLAAFARQGIELLRQEYP
jgi:hypothetical protein